LLLLKQLEECRKPPCDCKEQEEPKEEKKPEEETKEEVKEEAPREEQEEPVISEEKLKKLQNTKQGKKSYKEYLRNQLRVIGLAGIIAMSTAVYAQSQVLYKNGIIIYAVLEKEFPFISKVKNLIISDKAPSQSQSSSSDGSNNTVVSANTQPSSTSGSTFSNTNTALESNTESTVVNNNTARSPLTPAEQEQIKKGEELLEEEKKEVTNLDPKLNQFGTPIVPPTTTNTNPQSE